VGLCKRNSVLNILWGWTGVLHLLFWPKFQDVPLAVDPCCWGLQRANTPGLTNSEIIFEFFQPMLSRYLNLTDGRTDRQLAVAIPRSAYQRAAKNTVIVCAVVSVKKAISHLYWCYCSMICLPVCLLCSCIV